MSAAWGALVKNNASKGESLPSKRHSAPQQCDSTRIGWDLGARDVASSYLSGFVELLLQPRYRHGCYTAVLAGGVN